MQTQTDFLAQDASRDNYNLLRIYAWYRALLAGSLLCLFALGMNSNVLGTTHPVVYGYTVVFYTGLNLLTLVNLLWKRTDPPARQLFVVCLTDVIALTLIAHCSGGITGSVGMLIFITVAVSGIFVRGVPATLLAGLACVAIIAENITDNTDKNPLAAVLLSVLIFVTSQLFQYLTRRILKSQKNAEEQTMQAELMQQLNQLIVQRMSTGIVVVDNETHVLLYNAAAARLLNLPLAYDARTPLFFSQMPLLHARLQSWQANPYQRTAFVQLDEGSPEIQLDFASLEYKAIKLVLVYAEDTRFLAQRAQQLKLASLGQLTANIAHEVRNPLGAISHAAQLLSESPQLFTTDKRLANIIQNHSMRVNGIVENVLQLSRRQAAQLELRDLGVWLVQFTQRYQQNQVPSFDLELCMPEDALPVTVDFSQMEQVLINLCDNAARHSKQKTGCAKVTLYAYYHSTLNIVCLDVVDYGDGIADKYRARIFEPFFTTESQGTGLGLYIARELCQASQASLDYKRDVDGRSCFQISFQTPHK